MEIHNIYSLKQVNSIKGQQINTKLTQLRVGGWWVCLGFVGCNIP